MSKTIFNMFVCYRIEGNKKWIECVNILNKIKFPTSIPTGMGHHLGLSIQVLLDTNIEDSFEFSKGVSKLFPDEPIIVIGEVNTPMTDDPIGQQYTDDLIGPGRMFDNLVKENKRGIYIFKK